jgi:hypothetical protein
MQDHIGGFGQSLQDRVAECGADELDVGMQVLVWGCAATPVTPWPAATSCRAVARPSRPVTPVSRIRTPGHLHGI